MLFQIPQRYRFSSKSQLDNEILTSQISCFRYHKGTDFQANHNKLLLQMLKRSVVLDTTKVQIFKQITTPAKEFCSMFLLFQIPQRYRFSSKSQPFVVPAVRGVGCFRYHKGTDFQANHNSMASTMWWAKVVLDTTKVQIFKQITTEVKRPCLSTSCFRYHKGTDFQANHNMLLFLVNSLIVVLDTTKVQIFKQITTHDLRC